jgi:hypothetical protein
MGILLSVLQSFFKYLAPSQIGEAYKVKDSAPAAKPKTHKICRSTNESKLSPYQSKIDNLKSNEIIYVNISIYFNVLIY